MNIPPEEEEDKCEFVSSIGILKSCDLRSMYPQICRFLHYNRPLQNQPNGTIIYVCNADMRGFYKHLHEINYKFVLVSGDADETCPDDILSAIEFNNLINHPLLIHWFSQNCVISNHPKITQIPIGLDYHTLTRFDKHDWGNGYFSPKTQELQLKQIADNAPPYWERKMKCYSNFHFLTNTHYGKTDRLDAIQQIPDDLIYYQPIKMNREEVYKKQSQYAFVVSPHGNGYDCHRTWESLILGNIVIVKTSPIDPLFTDLPVYIVNEWSEITEELLQKISREFRTKRFCFEKLTLKYWVDLFHSFGSGGGGEAAV